MLRTALLLALVVLSPGRSTQPSPATSPAPSPSGGAPPSIEVVFLANEGFLLRGGEATVLIDPFVTRPYSIYGAVEGELADALRVGAAPFDDVDLVLTSHAHPDHFQLEPARAFLTARDPLFVSSPQVIERLASEDFEPTDRQVALAPTRESPARVAHAGVDVELFPLSHGMPDVQNLGHVIELDGVTVLHLGDAEMSEENFASYGLAERGVDVALVPYWYFEHEPGPTLVQRHFPGARLIACHVPPADAARLRAALADAMPGVEVPSAPLQSWTLTAREED